MNRRWSTRAASLAAAAVLVACSSDDDKASSDRPTRAEVYAAIQASTAPDTDGDGLPDDVEDRWRDVLGTDRLKADTDGDGASDAVEVFGTSWIWFQSEGQAGAPAGADAAGVANVASERQEADAVDSDGDAVPDWVEYAGYRYDWAKARFVTDPTGVRTDPLQWSTDQDAYSDGMEVSGLNMDVAVRAPGDHPLVPAYPDISVELVGYTLTLNEDVSYGLNERVEKGTSWSREVESSHSLEFEVGQEIAVSASVSLTDLGCSVESTTSFSMATTDTSTVSSAVGGSVLEAHEWNRTRSYNPSDAARIKLYVKVRNLGTAPASNIVPTLSLRIGGADVATFEPPSLSVATLLPGAQFPPDDDVNWVLDAAAEGVPLSLTDWELRALESGAPVSLSVAQKRADVMRLEDGQWVRVGDAGDYLARILSMTTDLFADVGAGPDGVEGNFIHARVASDDTPTAPPVTLAEALAWTMNFRVVGDHYAVDLRKLDGSVVPITLAGRIGDDGEPADDGLWRWQIDALTLARNGFVTPDAIPLEELLALRLGPLTRIALRAPRLVTEPGPVIHAAYATPTSGGYQVVTCVSDYDGLGRVVFLDGTKDVEGHDVEVELRRDGRGPYFYSATVQGELVGDGTERIRAESTRTAAGSEPPAPLTSLREVYVIHTDRPLPPVVENVTYRNVPQPDRLYASVRSPTAGIGWVRIYHESFLKVNTGEAGDGYLSLVPVTNTFEDPHGWEKRGFLPVGGSFPVGLRLVAFSSDGLYTVVPLTGFEDYRVYRTGTFGLGASFDWTATDEWSIALSDFEQGPPPPTINYVIEQNSYGNPGTLLWWWGAIGWGGLPDVYLRDSQGYCPTYYLGFFQAGAYAGSGTDFYYSANRQTIRDFKTAGHLSAGWTASGGTAEALGEPWVPYVFFFETENGRLGKLIVTSRVADSSGAGEWCNTSVYGYYTVFVKDGDP